VDKEIVLRLRALTGLPENTGVMAKTAAARTAGLRRAVTTRSVDTKRLITVSSGADPAQFEGLEPDDAQAWRHDNIGRLVLFVFHAFEARLLDSYEAAGFDGFRQVHLNVLRHIDLRHGTRIVDLAVRAGVTKGAMGQLVEECARLGLVELVSDPADGRAKIVSYSKRGRAFMTVTRRSAKRIEANFAKLLGSENYVLLRSLLIELRTKITDTTLTKR
jgi:DNA-binding MarR family transcriptional regulator